MIVKTRITNPTGMKQRYGWVPKHGMFVGAGESVVIDGDIYTLAKENRHNHKAINADIASNRVIIKIITDLEVEKPEQEKVETPVTENKKDVQTVVPPAVPPEKKPATKKVPRPRNNKKDNIFENPIEDEKHNILGKGFVEGGIKENKPPAYSPITGEKIQDPVEAPAVEISAAWEDPGILDDKKLDQLLKKDEEEEEAVEIPKDLTREKLWDMPWDDLLKIARSLGIDTHRARRKTLVNVVCESLKI